jgi:hypothetical protein
MLCGSHYGLMPIPQYNILEHLDQPCLPEDKLTDLDRFWKEHRAAIAWTQGPLDLMLAAAATDGQDWVTSGI